MKVITQITTSIRWLLLACVWLPTLAIAEVPAADEYKLKAALLYKLTRFIEWPDNGLADNFGICVLGKDNFGSALDTLEKRKVRSQAIIIHRIKLSKNVDKQCQLIFISDSKQGFLPTIFKSLAQRPILTIGDSKSFAEKGGMIQFTRGAKRIGFKINLQQAKAARLSIAAPLLELATIVKTKGIVR